MLRPATPLAVIFLGAFVLLLLSTLSTPIIKAIPLASFSGNTFGVFGFCQGSKCSPLGVGYNETSLTDNASTRDFSLPTSARHSLSSILIVHPVAAFLTLICFGLSVAAHFHSPAHSPRYLLALLIFTIPTVLASLLAFLVDILVFVPHVQWGGWIVLAATVLIIASMVLTCAMRRTLVSRKARKKRIAENAEMSGENYYAQRAAVDAGMQASASAPIRSVPPPSASFAAMTDFPKAESPPPLPSLSPGSDKAADFATFNVEKKNSGDERMPLSAAGAAPGRGRSGSYSQWRGGPNDAYGPPPMDQRGDPYGPGAAAMGMGAPLRHQSSANSMGSRSSMRGGRGGGPPPFYGNGRGRGGYPPPMPVPRGGGYGPPRGAPYGRGMRGGPMGYGGQMTYPPVRGGYGPRGGSIRGPPPNYDPQRGYYGGPPPNGPPSSAGPYGGSTYVDDMPSMRRPSMDNPDMPIGQAVEMDANNGMPSPTRENFGLRESDVDVQGMIGMQQQRRSEAGGQRSPTSVYSEEPSSYLPVRSGWNTSSTDPNSTNSQLRTPHTNSSSALAGRALSPIAHSPVHNNAIDHARRPSIAASDSYYEDIDPTFTARSSSAPPPASRITMDPGPIPSSLMAGNGGGGLGPRPRLASTSGEHLAPVQTALLERTSSASSLAEGARSPAESETSHYTSVSQRPVNPEWLGSAYPMPPPMMQGQYQPYPPQRRPVQQQQPRGEDVLLGGNPDFSIPGVGAPRVNGAGGGRSMSVGTGGYRGRGGGMGTSSPPRNGGGVTPVSRYPTNAF